MLRPRSVILTLFLGFLLLLIPSPSLAQQETEDDEFQPGRHRIPQQPPPPPPPAPTRNQNQIEPQYHHLYDHPALVNRTYGQPFTKKKWRCDFLYNDCFLKNRVLWAPFRVTRNFAEFAHALVLDVGLAARSLHTYTGRPKPIYVHHGSRLRSNGYFPAEYKDACLVLSYYWSGAGRKSLKVLQINEETACIYADEIGSADLAVQTQGAWKDVQLQLDLKYGHAKFVLEFEFDAPDAREFPHTRFDYSQLGAIAIRDFSIGYGTCQRSDATAECDVPEQTSQLAQDLLPNTRPYYGNRFPPGTAAV